MINHIVVTQDVACEAHLTDSTVQSYLCSREQGSRCHSLVLIACPRPVQVTAAQVSGSDLHLTGHCRLLVESWLTVQ